MIRQGAVEGNCRFRLYRIKAPTSPALRLRAALARRPRVERARCGMLTTDEET